MAAANLDGVSINTLPGEPFKPFLGGDHDHVTLSMNFAWRKFKSSISDERDPEKPLYIISYKIFPKLRLIFRRATGDDGSDGTAEDDNSADESIIGTGTVNNVSIDSSYTCHGRKDKLVAQKRFHTLYTHRSMALSVDGKPQVVTWSGDCGLKRWDFVCVDENQAPLAKFTANLWGLKKLGKVELMGPRANDPAFRDEMVITGILVGYTMIWRANNIFQLFGSLFGKPGNDREYPVQEGPAPKNDDTLTAKESYLPKQA
jgi:hypothetical protein